MACSGPTARATPTTQSARSASRRRWPGESRCPGASNATTERPARTSGSTKAPSCEPRPSQPWTRRTVGPWPQRHAVTRWSSPRQRGECRATSMSKGRPVARTARSRLGRGWGRGEVNSRSARRTPRSSERTKAVCSAALVKRTAVCVRTTVLLLSRKFAEDDSMESSKDDGLARLRRRRAGRCDQALERYLGARDRRRCAQELQIRVEPEHDAVNLVGELVRIDVRAELSLGHRDARGGGERVEPVLAGLGQRIARGAGLIVELGDRTDEEAAAGALAPLGPALEQRPDPRLAARLLQRGRHHELDELPRGLVHDGHAQRFLGTEVRKQPALR